MADIIPWSARSCIFTELMKHGQVTIQGNDLPDPEDPSDPEFMAVISISESGAGAGICFLNGRMGGKIPSISIPEWNKNTFGYFKHWLSKVLEDPLVYRANEIRIKSTEGWMKEFKSQARKSKP